MCPDPFQQLSHQQQQQQLRQHQMAAWREQERRRREEAERRRHAARQRVALQLERGPLRAAQLREGQTFQQIPRPMHRRPDDDVPAARSRFPRRPLRFACLMVLLSAIAGVVMSLPDIGWLYTATALISLGLVVRLRPSPWSEW